VVKEFVAKHSNGLTNYVFFSVKPENVNEEILQLKIPTVAKFNAKPTYCLLSVTQLISVTFKKITCHSN